MIHRVLLGAAAVVLAVGLAGCVSNAPIPTPSPSAVVGVWHHGSDILRLNADDTFSLDGIPLGVVEQRAVAMGEKPVGPNVSVTGTWSIGSGGTDVGGAPGVHLEFAQPRKIGFDYGMTLVVSGDMPTQLFVLLGPPDSGIRYSFTQR